MFGGVGFVLGVSMDCRFDVGDGVIFWIINVVIVVIMVSKGIKSGLWFMILVVIVEMMKVSGLVIFISMGIKNEVGMRKVSVLFKFGLVCLLVN